MYLKSYFLNTLYSLSESIKRRTFDLEDYLFEKKYGLDLSGIIKNNELVSENTKALKHATAYHAVWCRNLRELLMESSKYEIQFKAFIDIGSGKGKACFYAAQNKYLSFSEIIGIEFSLPLIHISEINKQIINSKNISFMHCDATQYRLPESPNVIFMFNPFDDVILEEFLRNNINHFRKHKSIVAYANDIHRKSIESLGFSMLFRNSARNISIYRM